MTQNPAPDSTTTAHSSFDDLFARLRGSGYFRDTDRRWFGGVCAGLADRFDVDPLLIRAAAIVLALLGGIGIGIYLALWLVLPDLRGDLLLERALRGGEAWPIVLLVVATLGVVGILTSIGSADQPVPSLIGLAVVAGIVWYVATRGRQPRPRAMASSAPSDTPGVDTATMAAPQAPHAIAVPPAGPSPELAERYRRPAPAGPPRAVAPPRPPRPRRRRPSGYVGLISFGVAITLFGIGAVLASPLGYPSQWFVVAAAAALAGVSAVVLGLGLTGRSSGFSGFLVIVLAFVTMVSGAASGVDVGSGAGDRAWTPVVVSAPVEYRLGAGQASLDLSRVSVPAGDAPARITAGIGAGELTVIVPRGRTIDLTADVGLGQIVVRDPSGTTTGDAGGPGRSVHLTFGNAATPDLVVRAEVGFGQIIIEEN